jgi:nucleotide-binding universal stress UspA family protein
MYTRILVPLDGSTFAEAALPLALSLTGKTGASMHLVSVLEPVPPSGENLWSEETRDCLTDYLGDVAERARRAGVEVTTAVRFGPVADTLLLEADEERADLIVLATHGRGSLARALLGSVAYALSRRARTPLMFVRPREDADAEPGLSRPLRTILVPLDGSEHSESALDKAVELGQAFGSHYHLTRIVHHPVDLDSPHVPFTAQVDQEILAAAKASALDYVEQQADRMRRRGLHVTTSVAVDVLPAHGILSEADAVGCDLIAMSTHGRSDLRRVALGSVANRVLRGARRPVMLYRPEPVPALLL